MAGALIITAELGDADQAWLDRLRRTHFPPERNLLAAHLTMFHALPPSLEAEVRHRLAQAAKGPLPRAEIAGLMDLGGGVAFRVVSDDLDFIRAELADAFRGSLSAQDGPGWRPHVTIQNKVAPKVARALLTELERGFAPRRLTISGLGLHRYLGGPWETLATYAFRGRELTSPTPLQLRSNAARPASRTEASIGISSSSPIAASEPSPTRLLASSIASSQSDAS